MSKKNNVKQSTECVGEPVAWMDRHFTCDLYKNKPELDVVPLYTTPQPAERKRTWVKPQEWRGLTDEEKADIAAQGHQRWKEYAEAIEAKLREKNSL